MSKLTADFSTAFSRDLKRKAAKRGWNLVELEKVVDLILENTPEANEVLRRRHKMQKAIGNIRWPAILMVRREGFEPPTY